MKAQKNMFKSSILVAALGLIFAGNAMAVTNGSFSNGLTGWSTLGDVAVQSGSILMTTASVGFEDDFPEAAGTFNASGNAAADLALGGFEAFAGLTAGALDTPDFAYEGSLLKQTFNVNAGDTLSFNWNMFTNEGVSADYAFVVINGTVNTLASATNATIASVPYALSTGGMIYSQTFAAATAVNLAFGVVDVTDYNVTSALWLDNVKVTAPVPEPETYAMLLAGLGLMGFAARRRRNNI